jgi:hypothetical protein
MSKSRNCFTCWRATRLISRCSQTPLGPSGPQLGAASKAGSAPPDLSLRSGRNRSLHREHRRFESHAGGHATRTSIFVSKQTTTISLQIVVCIAHHRNHRSTLGARLCAVRPDASSLLRRQECDKLSDYLRRVLPWCFRGDERLFEKSC